MLFSSNVSSLKQKKRQAFPKLIQQGKHTRILMICRDLLHQEAPGKKRANTDDIEESTVC